MNEPAAAVAPAAASTVNGSRTSSVLFATSSTKVSTIS